MDALKGLERMNQAIEQLVCSQPLHGGIVSQWRLIADASVQTMGIGFGGGRLRLYFNPGFIEAISNDELAAVLCHETNHVLFGHCHQQPTEGINRNVRVIAEEVTVNEWVTGPLPCRPMLLSDYPMLPANETTEKRYERLLEVLPSFGESLDDHTRWQEVRDAGTLSEAELASVITRAWKGLSDTEREKIQSSPQTSQMLNASTDASILRSLIEGKASINWQAELRHFVGASLRRRPIFTRPPRRYPELVGVLPARGRRAGDSKVLVAIDTSASMPADDLSDISAELAIMSRTFAVTVVEIDSQIREVYRYRPIRRVSGGGGTDFRPLFRRDFLGKQNPDLVIYFTDGGGVAPSSPPSMPVIWVLTPKGQRPCSWGRVISMNGSVSK